MATRNPKDSMKSTWRDNPSTWGFFHKFINLLDLYPIDINQAVPVFEKTDKMPYLTAWSCHVWILAHAAWPLLLQKAYFWYMGRNMHMIAAIFLYSLAFRVNGMHEAKILRRLGHRFGFLDGDKHERDGIPDVGVRKVVTSIVLTTSVRPIFTLFLTHQADQAPALSWWLPVELALYSVVLDFWFYVWHRSAHEVDGLWKLHRTHHLTKHPNPLLSSYADEEQEFVEIAVVPLLTYFTLKAFGLPMGFADWWICHQYIIFSEAFGHSGLRVYSVSPSVISWLLELVNCELVIEDHDLHHRHGYRQSSNYGKQTRVWDRLFGSTRDRIEAQKANVDMANQIDMPLL